MTSKEQFEKALTFYGNRRRAREFVRGYELALAGRPAPQNSYGYTGWTVGYDERKAREEKA
jgi:hypothetical protein